MLGGVSTSLASKRRNGKIEHRELSTSTWIRTQDTGEAVDRVRRREHKELKAEGDERLTGTKYDWLRNPATMDAEQRREFASLRQSELKTARARLGAERNRHGPLQLCV
jgi:Transposase